MNDTANLRLRLAMKREISQFEGGSEAQRSTALSFHADYTDPANAAWAVNTPTASLSMTVTGAIADMFTPGRTYDLVISGDEFVPAVTVEIPNAEPPAPEAEASALPATVAAEEPAAPAVTEVEPEPAPADVPVVEPVVVDEEPAADAALAEPEPEAKPVSKRRR